MTWGLNNKQGDYNMRFGVLKQDWKRLILELVFALLLFVYIWGSQEKGEGFE